MSDDGAGRCKENDIDSAAYTLLPIYRDTASSRCVRARYDDRSSVKLKQTLRQHRNRTNRDISLVRGTCSDDSELTCDHSQYPQSNTSASHSTIKRFRLLNVCLIVLIHLIWNEIVTSVSCDEFLDAVGARGHFTHTWAVHIPGGDEVAQQVALEHDMHLRGKVRLKLRKKSYFFELTLAVGRSV